MFLFFYKKKQKNVFTSVPVGKSNIDLSGWG